MHHVKCMQLLYTSLLDVDWILAVMFVPMEISVVLVIVAVIAVVIKRKKSGMI